MNKIKSFFKEDTTASTAKVALWFAVGNIIVNGLGFLTTPIFSRILSKAEFGQFSNFLSWGTLLYAIVSLNLGASIMRAKFDFTEDFDSYVLSVLCLSSLSTLIVYGTSEIFPGFYTKVLSMDIACVRLLFLYFLFNSAFQYILIECRVTMKYKFCVFLSISLSLLQIVTALVLISLMDDKALGRILGQVIPFVFLGITCWILLLKNGKHIRMKHMKYACGYSIPLMLHTISGHILGSSDKVMIKSFCGAEAAALYAIPYTISSIASILWVAMNQAWAPWQYEQMNANNSEEICKKSKWYLGIFAIIIVGVLLVAPEVLYMMGGKPYMEAVWVMPPVILACAYQFVYSLYVNIEMFMKKNIQISLSTMGAAVFNIVTNAIFIPKYGYIAAAYTTLLGYLLLLIVHFTLVKIRGEYTDSIDAKYVWGMTLAMTLFGALMFFMYNHQILRYCAIITYGVGVIVFALKKKDLIFDVLRIKRR